MYDHKSTGGRDHTYSKQILCIQVEALAPFTHVSLLAFPIPRFLTVSLPDRETSPHPPTPHASHFFQVPL